MPRSRASAQLRPLGTAVATSPAGSGARPPCAPSRQRIREAEQRLTKSHEGKQVSRERGIFPQGRNLVPPATMADSRKPSLSPRRFPPDAADGRIRGEQVFPARPGGTRFRPATVAVAVARPVPAQARVPGRQTTRPGSLLSGPVLASASMPVSLGGRFYSALSCPIQRLIVESAQKRRRP